MESQFDYHGNTDVVIQVGEEPDIITFFAHSDILRKKSPYFYTALSNTWARREGENIILKKPNISPTVFSVILEYFNTNNVRLNHCNGSIIFDILVAVDELLIENVFVSSIQEQLMHDKSEWLQNNFAIVLHTIFERDECKELFLYCMDKICWNPNIIFKSPEFLDFESSILIHILKQNNLQIEEIDIWDNLIRWGMAQSFLLDLDISKWSKDDFLNLQETLKDLIPLIRFSELSTDEYYDKIFPFRDILPLTLKNDLITFRESKYLPDSMLPPRNPIISIDSNIILPQQALKIPEWIIQVQKNTFIPSSRLLYQFKLLLRGSRDGFTPQTFHEKCDNTGPNLVVLKIHGDNQVIGGYNPIGWKSLKTNRWQYTEKSFLFSFGNRGNLDDAKLSKVQSGCEAIYDDPSFGPCFGKTDLDMRRQFNEKDNCSAKKRCYKHSDRKSVV